MTLSASCDEAASPLLPSEPTVADIAGVRVETPPRVFSGTGAEGKSGDASDDRGSGGSDEKEPYDDGDGDDDDDDDTIAPPISAILRGTSRAQTAT